MVFYTLCLLSLNFINFTRKLRKWTDEQVLKWENVGVKFHRWQFTIFGRKKFEQSYTQILNNPPFVNWAFLPRSNFSTPLSTSHSFRSAKKKKEKKKKEKEEKQIFVRPREKNCVYRAVHSKRSRCRILFGVYRVSVSGSVKHRAVSCRLNVCRVNMIKLMARRSCAKMDELISIEPEIVLPF